MLKLRFWQKTYLFTLLLFLVSLYGGITFIGWQNQQQILIREVDKAINEQHFIMQSIMKDISAIQNNLHLQTQGLIRSYSGYYSQHGILLELRMSDETIYSNLPSYNGDRPELNLQSGEQNWVIRTVDQERYLYVVSNEQDYVLTSAHSISAISQLWNQMRLVLTIGAAAISVILAIGLYFTLRSLSRPLERLSMVADEFSAGNLDIRAVKNGDDEVGILADSFNNLADTVKSSLTEIQQTAEENERMAANLSHEIRTPLTAIQGYAEFMSLADLTPEEQQESLTYITAECKRLQQISQRMLQLYALRHDEVKMEPVSISNVILQAEKTISQQAVSRDVDIIMDFLPTFMIKGDEILLISLFMNLFENAIKASSPGKRIVVTSKIQPGHLIFSIKDQGHGMEASLLKRMGEPFYRPDKSRSRIEGGAGLGLAICQQISKIHNASLHFDSSPGNGTTVTIKFTTS